MVFLHLRDKNRGLSGILQIVLVEVRPYSATSLCATFLIALAQEICFGFGITGQHYARKKVLVNCSSGLLQPPKLNGCFRSCCSLKAYLTIPLTYSLFDVWFDLTCGLI
jgi:hypothetical protein